MKKKLLCGVCVVLLGVIYITTRNPMRKEVVTTDTWETKLEEWKEVSPNELEEHVKIEISDTYRMDADIMVSDELESYEVKTVYLSRHVYDDVEAVLERWLSYCGVDSYSKIPKSEYEVSLENDEILYYAGADFGEDNQSWAQVRSVYAMMHKPFANKYGEWSLNNMLARQQLGCIEYEDFISIDEEIFSKEQISELKRNIESIYEVEFMEDSLVYTYTLEGLQDAVEYEQSFNETYNYPFEPWEPTEEDEGTVICFLQGYEEIPFFYDDPANSITGASWTVGNYCIATVSKDGIEGLNITNPYDICGVGDSIDILTFGEFMEKHVQMSKGVDTTVVNVGLYHLPIYTGEGLDFVTKPIWCVQTETEDEFGFSFRELYIYDAVTGEELSW